ncbi:ABC transporter substrate-binding protein, partial [bacterium]|nr:ABC transporter substrate-binding protein [bacterium]
MATRFAIDEINEKGGWFGKRIELLEFDNESTPLGSKNAAKKAIQENVSAVIGASWSSNSLAAAPVLQQAGIPMITPASTNPKVTTVGHCIFRIPFLDSFQGVVMADFAIFELKAKTASILINVDNQYSTGLAEIFINRFKEQGGKILSKGNYLQDAANFTPLLKQVKELNPEVTFVPGYPRDSALIIKQARKMAVTTIFLGGDGWSDRMYEYAGEEL